jgi:hypothetical protein
MPTVGVLIGIFNVTLLWVLFRRREVPALQMLFPLLILASSGPFIMYEISGMEMPLFSLLFLCLIVWLDRVFTTGKLFDYLLVAFACVLLSLCRPEGVISLPIVGVAVLWLKKYKGTDANGDGVTRNVLISVIAFVVAITAYHAWRANYFGEWLPTPLLSKGGGGKSLIYAWGENFNYYFIKQSDYFPPVGYYFAALVILAITGLRLSKSAATLRKTEVVTVALIIVYAVVYFNFRDWMPGMRYHAAYVGLMLLPAVHVQGRFFEPSETRGKRTSFWLIGIMAVVLNFGVLAQLRVVTKRAELSSRLCTVALGKWLKGVFPPGSVMAVSDVGAIPYYSGFQAIDFHPESLTDIYIAKNGFSIDYVRERDPDIVVLPSRSIYVAKFYPEHYEMALDRRFDDYRLIGVSRYDWFDDRCYWVYIRSSFPKLTDEQFEAFPHGLGSVMRKYR